MAGDFALYRRMIAASVRAQLTYRANFLLAALGTFMGTGVEIVGAWALFTRFGGLEGWSFAEVAFMYGFVAITFAVADALSTGFDAFGAMVRAGEFDRVLLRPRSTVLQLLGAGLAVRRVGRLLQGALVLAWAVATLDVEWQAWRLALTLLAALGSVAMFIALFIVQATAAFWTVEALEVFNAFTYGGTYAAQYPMSIYPPWFRRFFTFVVPIALVTYFPLVAVLGREDPLGTSVAVQAVAPLGGLVFLGASLALWRIGVRHYTSTGS